MKRPDIETIFGPIALQGEDVAHRLLGLFNGKYEAYLSRYYAKMRYDSGDDSFCFWDEEMNLDGQGDLLKRLARDGGGRWSCDLNLGFYPATVDPAVFSDSPDGLDTTVLIFIDSGITRFLEEEEVPRIPFVFFLIEIAKAIGANWFLSGVNFDHWKPLPASQILDREKLPRGTYVVGWQNDAFDEHELISGLGVQKEDIKRSTFGYKFALFFPEP